MVALRRTALLLALALIFSLCGCGASSAGSSWQDQYDLGVRYLSEGNYAEAVIAFTAAIEIDPKQPDAYLGLAEAYLAGGDRTGAIEVLEQGLEATGDSEIKDMLDQVVSEGEETPAPPSQRPPYSGQLEDGLQELMGDAAVSLEEFTIDGVPVVQLTIEQVQQMRPETEEPIFGIRENSTAYTYSNWSWQGEEKLKTFDVEQQLTAEHLTQVRYYAWPDRGWLPLDVGFRGLHTGDALIDVLETLGFTPEGARRLSEDASAWEEGLAMVLNLDFTTGDFSLGQTGGDIEMVFLTLEGGGQVWLDFSDQRLEGLTISITQ